MRVSKARLVSIICTLVGALILRIQDSITLVAIHNSQILSGEGYSFLSGAPR